MTSIYHSPVIKAVICGHEFNIHKGILDKMLVTGDVSDQWNDEEVYNYTINTAEPPSLQFSENIVNWLYTGNSVHVNLNSTAYYQFFDKYAKDRTILDNCPRQNLLMDQYKILVDWIKSPDKSISLSEPDYLFLGNIVTMYVKNIYNDVRIWSFKYRGDDAELDGNVLHLGICSPDNFCLFILDCVNTAGHNIWDCWRAVTEVTEEELLYFGIPLNDVPNKYLGKQ